MIHSEMVPLSQKFKVVSYRMWNYVSDIQGGFILHAECRKAMGAKGGMK